MQTTKARMSAEKSTWMKNLLGIYGSLLTRKQFTLAQMHFEQHLSLSEIGRRQAVSRQAVHDAIRHVTKVLEEYEEKLKLSGLLGESGNSRSRSGEATKTRLIDLRNRLSHQRIIYSVDWVVQDLTQIIDAME